MSGALSESARRDPGSVDVRAATLIAWAGRAESLHSFEVLQLVAEIFRLRAKVRYLRRRVLDLEGAPFDRELTGVEDKRGGHERVCEDGTREGQADRG